MLHIRGAEAADAPLIVRFVQELAAHEGRPPETVSVTADVIRRDGFGEAPKFQCALADWDGQSAGLVVFFQHYSMRRGEAEIHIENLYVSPAFRKRGIGMALLQYLAKRTVAEGLGSIIWQVLDSNETGVDFYLSLGAVKKLPRHDMHLSGEALLKLAGSA